jgi:hypothetical protein
MAALTPEQMREYARTVANTYQAGVNPQEIVDTIVRDLQAVSQTPEEAFRNLDLFEQQVQDIQSGYTSLAGMTPQDFAEFTTNIGRTAGFDRAPPPPPPPADTDTSGIMGASGNGVTLGGMGTGAGAGAGVDLSGLTPEQQAFAQTLPANLQDDYLASIQAGLTDETSGATLQDIADLLRGRGLTFEEASQATGLAPDDPNYQPAVRAFYGLEPTASDLTPGGMQTFSYTDFPGGIFGPGQALPNIFVPAGQQQPTTSTQAAPEAGLGAGTAAPGPRTMVSPGITTYAYPQPFGPIDIFGRPTATTPTAYTPPAPTNNNNNNT